jgi:hypothetical protein
MLLNIISQTNVQDFQLILNVLSPTATFKYLNINQFQLNVGSHHKNELKLISSDT